MIDGFLAEILIFFSVRNIVATQTFISFSGKISCLKTGSCFFTGNYFKKKTCIGSFCNSRVSEVIQVWHTPTQKNYMRFRMRVFLCFILRPSGVPSAIFNRVFKLFFWMRCHAGRIPIVNRVKIRGHIPPMVGWEQKMSTKAGRGGGGKGRTTPFLFGEGWVKKMYHIG